MLSNRCKLARIIIFGLRVPAGWHAQLNTISITIKATEIPPSHLFLCAPNPVQEYTAACLIATPSALTMQCVQCNAVPNVLLRCNLLAMRMVPLARPLVHCMPALQVTTTRCVRWYQCQRPELVLLAVLEARLAVKDPPLAVDSEAARLSSVPIELLPFLASDALLAALPAALCAPGATLLPADAP